MKTIVMIYEEGDRATMRECEYGRNKEGMANVVICAAIGREPENLNS